MRFRICFRGNRETASSICQFHAENQYERKSAPLKVFEVETSHRIDHALSSLAHAYDVWRPERLYLMVSDERDLNRAIKLVEPYVKGAFYRISRKLKIYTYKEKKDLYDNIINHKDMIADLSM
jgi:hypothetical protein